MTGSLLPVFFPLMTGSSRLLGLYISEYLGLSRMGAVVSRFSSLDYVKMVMESKCNVLTSKHSMGSSCYKVFPLINKIINEVANLIPSTQTPLTLPAPNCRTFMTVNN